MTTTTTTTAGNSHRPAFLRSLRPLPYCLLLCLSGGLLLGLGWYKFSMPLLLMGFVPLLLLEDEVSKGSFRFPKLTLWAGSTLMFILWNIVVYWWLWNASGWVTWAAWIANSLLMSLPVLAFHLIRKWSAGRFYLMAFVGCWLTFEYIHLHWDFSWIWLLVGNAFATWPHWVQWYEYTGVFGGSLWVLTASSLVFLLLTTGRGTVRLIATLFVPAAFSLLLYYTYEEKGPEVEMVVVQPNLDCYTEKFDYNAKTGQPNPNWIPYQEQVNRFIRLSQEAVTPNTRFLLWPETSLHELVLEETALQTPPVDQVAEMTRNMPGVSLVTGMDTYTTYAPGAPLSKTVRQHPSIGYYDVFNTAMLLNDTGRVEFYHKSQLVIGAETVPFPAVFRMFMLYFGGASGGLGRQPNREVFCNSQGQCGAPVICYESVYGEFVTDYLNAGPDCGFIFIITNDGWWDDTPGHRQHLDFARLRAIETRRAIARSANTGISCFISQRGDLLDSLPYDEMGALRGSIRENTEKTFYTRNGDYIGRLALFLAGFMLLSSFVKRRLERKDARGKRS